MKVVGIKKYQQIMIFAIFMTHSNYLNGIPRTVIRCVSFHRKENSTFI